MEQIPQNPQSQSPVFNPKLGLNFFDAMSKVAGGKKITRLEWGRDVSYIFYDSTKELVMINNITVPAGRQAKEGIHVYIISGGDLLATDWVVCKDTPEVVIS